MANDWAHPYRPLSTAILEKPIIGAIEKFPIKIRLEHKPSDKNDNVCSLIFTMFQQTHSDISNLTRVLSALQDLPPSDLTQIGRYTLQRAGAGVDNAVFFVSKCESQIAVLKCYQKRSLAQVSDIARCMHALIAQGVPIPRPLAAPSMLNGHPSMLLEFIEGDQHSLLSKENLQQTAKALALVHQITPPTHCFPTALTTIQDCLRYRNYCVHSQLSTATDCIQKSANWEYFSELPLCVNHGDISPGNIIFRSNGTLALLDTDHCCINYRLTDIARSLAFIAFTSQDVLDYDKMVAFLDSYHQENSLSALEKEMLYVHMILVMSKIALETYYYVEIKQECPKTLFVNSPFNVSYQRWTNRIEHIVSEYAAH